MDCYCCTLKYSWRKPWMTINKTPSSYNCSPVVSIQSLTNSWMILLDLWALQPSDVWHCHEPSATEGMLSLKSKKAAILPMLHCVQWQQSCWTCRQPYTVIQHGWPTDRWLSPASSVWMDHVQTQLAAVTILELSQKVDQYSPNALPGRLLSLNFTRHEIIIVQIEDHDYLNILIKCGTNAALQHQSFPALLSR